MLKVPYFFRSFVFIYVFYLQKKLSHCSICLGITVQRGLFSTLQRVKCGWTVTIKFGWSSLSELFLLFNEFYLLPNIYGDYGDHSDHSGNFILTLRFLYHTRQQVAAYSTENSSIKNVS